MRSIGALRRQTLRDRTARCASRFSRTLRASPRRGARGHWAPGQCIGSRTSGRPRGRARGKSWLRSRRLWSQWPFSSPCGVPPGRSMPHRSRTRSRARLRQVRRRRLPRPRRWPRSVRNNRSRRPQCRCPRERCRRRQFRVQRPRQRRRHRPWHLPMRALSPRRPVHPSRARARGSSSRAHASRMQRRGRFNGRRCQGMLRACSDCSVRIPS